MGHWELVSLDPVMRHQQPAGEALVDVVALLQVGVQVPDHAHPGG